MPAGSRFGRLFHARFSDPLGFGKSPSRFSDGRRRIERNRFGVLYLGVSLKVCFVEAILRDRRNGAVGDFPIEETELRAWHYAVVIAREALVLVDLRGDAPGRIGVPSDVAGAASHTLSRAWSVAFHEHPSAPDGIIYPSRLNEETNVAVYGRAMAKLHVVGVQPLPAEASLPMVLDTLNVALV